MFMANDVLLPRMGQAQLTIELPSYLRSIRPSGVKRCHDEKEEIAWDHWYREQTTSLSWRFSRFDKVNPSSYFKHGAMHDAESVFYLCILFFNRMWPRGEEIRSSDLSALRKERGKTFNALAQKQVGEITGIPYAALRVGGFPAGERFGSIYDTLNTINQYLGVPWYAIKGTGRGERYEFHLHDFMQRLLLNEIQRLRLSSDPILLEKNPIPVETVTQSSGNAYSHSLKPFLTSVRFYSTVTIHLNSPS